MIKVGDPIWANGFGCVTWVGPTQAGVALLSGGEPKVLGFVLHAHGEHLAEHWASVQVEDGRICDILKG